MMFYITISITIDYNKIKIYEKVIIISIENDYEEFDKNVWNTINKLESKMIEYNIKSYELAKNNKYSLDNRLELQIEFKKLAIQVGEKLKNYCYNNSYSNYYFESWQNCFNSKNPKFEFLDKLKNELQYLENKLSNIYYLINLENDILEIIKSKPGIYKKDLIKLLKIGQSKLNYCVKSLDGKNLIYKEKDSKYIKLYPYGIYN